ncbi:MAG: universal stress protein [Chloroflexi bacterium]|nr:universal stress protein [Chloroflexota bacterium]
MATSPSLPQLARVLVGSDGSDTAWLAAQYALLLAQRFKAEVVAVFVVNPHDAFRTGIHASEAIAEMRAQGRHALELVTELGRTLGVPVQMNLLDGDPKAALVAAAAREGADCLVVGSHGMGGLERVLLGSVSDHCVRHAPCPVLVVRPPRRTTS